MSWKQVKIAINIPNSSQAFNSQSGVGEAEMRYDDLHGLASDGWLVLEGFVDSIPDYVVGSLCACSHDLSYGRYMRSYCIELLGIYYSTSHRIFIHRHGPTSSSPSSRVLRQTHYYSPPGYHPC